MVPHETLLPPKGDPGRARRAFFGDLTAPERCRMPRGLARPCAKKWWIRGGFMLNKWWISGESVKLFNSVVILGSSGGEQVVNEWWVHDWKESGKSPCIGGLAQPRESGSSSGTTFVLGIILHPYHCSPPVSSFTTHSWIGPGRAIPQWSHHLKLEQFTWLHTNLYTMLNWFGLKEAVSGHRVEQVQKFNRLHQTDDMLIAFSSGPYLL